MSKRNLALMCGALLAVCPAFGVTGAQTSPQAGPGGCNKNRAVIDAYAISSPKDLIYPVCSANGIAASPIVVPEHWGLLGFDHDDANRLYVLQAYSLYGRQTGAVLIYDGRWKIVVLPPGLVGSFAVDRRQGIAYVYHNVAGDLSHSWISAVTARGKITRSFPAGPLSAGAQMVFDSRGYLIMLPSGQDDLMVFDPRTGKRLRSAHAYGCAFANGNDRMFYGGNCYGTVAQYDPRSFRILQVQRYSDGPVVGTGANELPKMVVDSRHIMYFVDERKEQMRVYHNRNAVPFKTYVSMAVRDIALDTGDNVYALIAPENPSAPRSINMYRKGSATLVRRYHFPKNVYPQRLTIVR